MILFLDSLIESRIYPLPDVKLTQVVKIWPSLGHVTLVKVKVKEVTTSIDCLFAFKVIHNLECYRKKRGF